MAALAAAQRTPKWVAEAKTFSTLRGHTSSVNALKLRLGGFGGKSVLWSGSGDETIRCWDIQAGKCVHEMERAHTGYVSSLAMQGDYIMSSSFDRTICLWNAERRQLIKSIKAHAHCINALCLHETGVVLSASWDQSVRVWDLRVREGGHGFVVALRLSSAPLSVDTSGNEVYCGLHDSSITACDLRTGGEVSQFKGHTGYVTSLQVTGKGTHLLSGSQDGTVRLTNVKTGTGRSIVTSDQAVFSVHAREEGGTRCCLSGHADGGVRITNIITGAAVRSYTGQHEGQVFSMVSEYDGCLITGAGDGKIVCWGHHPESSAKKSASGGGGGWGGEGRQGMAAGVVQRVWKGWLGRQRFKMQDRVRRPVFKPDGGSLPRGEGIIVKSESKVLYTVDGTEPRPGQAREIAEGGGVIELPAHGGRTTVRAKAVGRGGYESASVTIWREFSWEPTQVKADAEPEALPAKVDAQHVIAVVKVDAQHEIAAVKVDAQHEIAAVKVDAEPEAAACPLASPKPQTPQKPPSAPAVRKPGGGTPQKRVGGGFALRPKQPPADPEAPEPQRRTSKKPPVGAEGGKGVTGKASSRPGSVIEGSAAANRQGPLV